MDRMATHMRISGVSVSDTDVESRRAAATSLATSWVKEKIPSKIAAKAAEVAIALGGDGKPPVSLGDEVQAAIQKKSPAFLYEERPLDVGVCAGMAIGSILSGQVGTAGWTSQDVYATAIWSALSYQPALDAERRETLRQEILVAAQNWSKASSEKARERSAVPDVADIKINIGADTSVTHDIREMINKTVDPLRRNATLDREELDFLWWAQLGRSRLLGRQLTAILEPTRIVVAGIEGANLLRRLPCEVHREIVLKTLEQDPQLDLRELLAAMGDDLIPVSATIVKTNVVENPEVFPLLFALATSEVRGEGAALKRPISEWGARALLEATFARMVSQGVGKI